MSDLPDEEPVMEDQSAEDQDLDAEAAGDEDALEDTLEDEPCSLPSDLFANWPPALLAAWEQYQLPSLHDLLTTNERLASEVRRQNQELRRLAEAAAAAAAGTVATAESNARLLTLADGLRRAADTQQRRLLSGVIEACDSATRHHRALDEDRVRVLARLPKRTWWGQSLPGRDALERSLQASCDGARLLMQRLRQELDDQGAERLTPSPGEPFDPAWMRCTGRAPGALDRVISLERDGWRLQGNLIRPADVLVGNAATTTEGTRA